MLSPESSIAFYIANYPVKYYSLIMLVAMLLGTFLSYSIAKTYYKDISLNEFLDMLPITIICGILGARIYYVLMDWAYYSNHLIEIFEIYKGGLSIHGAILGGFLGGFCYIKKHKLNLWKYADIFAYGLLLGQIIGRFGNYFNIEAFGKPCHYSNLICLYIPEKYRPIQYLNNDFFHPTFLYEAFFNLIILLILFFVIRKLTKNTDGVIFISYLGLYSLGRFFIEGLRVDSVLNIGSIHIAQIVSFVLVIFSLIMFFDKIKSNKIKP